MGSGDETNPHGELPVRKMAASVLRTGQTARLCDLNYESNLYNTNQSV